MTKFYFTSVFILFFAIGFSQSYPYLNASTGNENEFPVDKDTNIYMFHGNRLVKTDKNFNTIWANTYSGFNFLSLLLSKTGSMYFIGKNGSYNSYLGKIASNGSISWIRNLQSVNAILSGTTPVTYTADCRSIILDRNNQLVITGESKTTGSVQTCFLLKADTNGNTIKFKSFSGNYSYVNNFTVLSDSVGYYKAIGLGLKPISGYSYGFVAYDDNLDVFLYQKETSINSNFYNPRWKVVKSKLSNNFYIKVITDMMPGLLVNFVSKFNINGQHLWSRMLGSSGVGTVAFLDNLAESEKGELLYSLSSGQTSSLYTSAYFKLDSNGVVNNFGNTMLKNYMIYNFMTSSYEIPLHAPRVIHDNNYYYDISGYSFASNPLTIQKFNSGLTAACSATLSNVNTSLSYTTSTVFSLTIDPITSYSIPAFSSIVTPVSFSINPNFCTVVEMEERIKGESEFGMYPNPAHNELYISDKNYAVNSVEVFDVNGKSIKSIAKDSSIDISNLPNGIYFIRIKTDKGEFNKKFIKE